MLTDKELNFYRTIGINNPRYKRLTQEEKHQVMDMLASNITPKQPVVEEVKTEPVIETVIPLTDRIDNHIDRNWESYKYAGNTLKIALIITVKFVIFSLLP